MLIVDESGSTSKFDKKKLEKLKDQPSKTAGLETVLSLAVGCRLMLRCNIDVTVVNGAIDTVMVIYDTRISNVVALLSRIHPTSKWVPRLLQPCYTGKTSSYAYDTS